MLDRYEKLRISLRYFLLGKQWLEAVDALEYGSSLHTGFRKDGITPEFQHQVEIAHYLRSLTPSFMYEEDTITSALLHDTPEDKGIKRSVIETRYNERVGISTEILNNHHWLSKSAQFAAMAEDPIASIVKGGDRSHNLQTMIGVFNRSKQLSYIDETEQYFLPMLKVARRNFPQQELAYENIKHILLSQIELLKAINND